MGKKKKVVVCEFCKNRIAIGEGDFISCECEEPAVAVSNYMATKDYLKYRSRKFKKPGRQKCA
jgi:hypothetical protein